jgi:hypothetical protein
VNVAIALRPYVELYGDVCSTTLRIA